MTVQQERNKRICGSLILCDYHSTKKIKNRVGTLEHRNNGTIVKKKEPRITAKPVFRHSSFVRSLSITSNLQPLTIKIFAGVQTRQQIMSAIEQLNPGAPEY